MATNSPEEIQHEQHQHEMKLPSTLMELVTAKRIHFMHRGLQLVESSIEIFRAMNEAIIFTFGQSGAGKSSTLNHLFDRQLASVSADSSCTRDVVYYVSSMSSSQWEVNNLKIGFVDVPGWGDGGGGSVQASNMATVEKFIATHPHLGRAAPKCYPNIIMIIVSANDNRANDVACPAVLMLKAIRQFRIIDKRRHNVVIVMTHTLAISVNSIKRKRDLYQSLCQKEFGFKPPFVYVENNTEDRDPPLKKVDDWTVLPDENGTKQPLNVFQCLINQMTANKDEVGIEAVRLFFDSSCLRKDLPLEEAGRTELVNATDRAFQRWRKIIIRGSLVGKRSSEVTQIIEHHVVDMPNCKREQFGPLISELLDSQFQNEEDFAGLKIADVQYRLKPYVLQDFEIALIIHLFKVETMLFPFLYEHIFHTYLINKDELKVVPENRILDLPNTIHISQGLDIPSFLKVNKFHDSEGRSIEFSINILTQTGMMTAHSLEGPVLHPVEHKDYEITFVIKEVVYEFYFDLKHPRDVKLKQTLQESINNLPLKFRDDNVGEYRNFFSQYGHFVIVKSAGGGLIEGTMSLKLEESRYRVIEPLLQNCIKTILSNSCGNDRDRGHS